jgi:hypothetical protein
VVYGPAQWARPSWTSGFPGSAFTLQPDGSLLCPADHPLYPQERRPERDGSIRLLYAARIGHCRSCLLRAQCQESSSTLKPRRVSAVFWPLSTDPSVAPLPLDHAPEPPPLFPLLWRDWPRCRIRRTWVKVLRSETLSFFWGTPPEPVQTLDPGEEVLTRAQRAQWRLSWEQRLVRNARPSTAPPLEVTIHGLPAAFAQSFGFSLVAAA